MLVLAFLVGSKYITRDAVRQGLNGEETENLTWMVLGAIVLGGRAMFIITEPGPYLREPWKIFYIWEGGLVYYGGFIATVGTVVWYAWKEKLPIWKLTDVFSVGGMLGLAVGRWGCFFAGDDHGRVIPGATDANHPIWAVKFAETVGPWEAHPAMDPAWIGQWLYPSQWMMSAKAFSIFVVAMLIAKRKKFDGQVTAILMMQYAVLRSIIELYRGDMDRGVYFMPDHIMRSYMLGTIDYPGLYMTTSQGISIVLFFLGLWLYLSQKNKGIAPVPQKKGSAKAQTQVSSDESKAA
jgi:phosphatidylglycerol---prolipoprotein diacylglyceryl transferase